MNDTKNLTDQEQEQEQIWALTRSMDRPGLIHLGGHLVLISIAVVWVMFSDGFISQALSTLILGILLVFLFAPLHESIHKTAFATPAINKVVGWICGWLLVLPPKYFQVFHMAHHRHTQIKGKDPELDTQKPQTWGQHFWYLSGLPYWIGQIRALIGFALNKSEPPYLKPGRRADVVNEARTYIALYLVVIAFSFAANSAALLYLWVIPMLVGQPFLRAFLVAEHTGCPEVADMFENTRTTLTNPVMQWLCWNMCFHVEHHAFTGLPFHQLPSAHQVLKPYLKTVANGYIEVNKRVVGAF